MGECRHGRCERDGFRIGANFAAVAARAAYAVYRIESARDKQAEDERRERHEDAISVQASKVTTSIEPLPRPVRAGGKMYQRFWMKAKNAHESPMYEVALYYCLPDDGQYAVLKEYKFGTIPAGEFVIAEPKTTTLMRAGENAVGDGRVAISFRDSAGIPRWRNVEGRLIRNRGEDIPLPLSDRRKIKLYTEYQGRREEIPEDD